jgi:transcriptional regulator with XRE-family HTH domain
MTAAQIKAARVLLGWTKRDLAERAHINRRTVANIETGKHLPFPSTVLSIRRAFEAAGLEFTEGKAAVRTAKDKFST